MKPILFFDAEINPENGQILDIGAVGSDGRQFHAASVGEFSSFVKEYEWFGGHNILSFDLKYLEAAMPQGDSVQYIDTLCLSPLLFPAKPYHRLLKDDKLQTDSLSNPLDDAVKSWELFCDEVAAFESLDNTLKQIWYLLLHDLPEFSGLFAYLDYTADHDAADLIQSYFSGKICANAPLPFMVMNHPRELAYCLALISADDRHSITPPWVQMNYPLVDNYMRILRNHPCEQGCPYCAQKLDVRTKLTEIFGYPEFRTYEGEPLQERAADAAVHNKSLLAIFPTGGGKSITFQLPALMAGENAKGLTVVISPLQSLMKDQVDNLAERGIADAVTINGLLSAVERTEAIERVLSGIASILYISPESLRSRTIEKLLLSRNVVRFVIDEAHCFSAWGQDFRVDYLYIGDFIRQLQEKKNISYSIPVSCFTATAKQKVIEDIRDYFKLKLGLDLELYATSAARSNLRYEVLYQADDGEKYDTLRRLIEQKNCPTIIYVSRTKRTVQIVQKLTDDGYSARPFHGKMDSSEKVENQEAFIAGTVQIIVATSAFGMGVDKKDVGLVIHYDISDSLENYVQEAGRAGRDPMLNADCYVLFNESDLDKHFIRLNQTKLSQSEIQQVWRAVKKMAGSRESFSRSALEIAREAGWSESGPEVETRVKTAIAALENAGYIERGQNIPHVYATSIMVKTMQEASERIRTSDLFDERTEQNAIRIVKSLISEKNTSRRADDAESRIDYLADTLSMSKEDVIEAVNLMRQEKLLADAQDMSAYIKKADSENKSMQVLMRFMQLEQLLLNILTDEPQTVNLKEINEQAEQQNIKGTSVKSLNTILLYWTIKGYIQKTYSRTEKAREIIPKIDIVKLTDLYISRIALARFIVGFLYDRAANEPANPKGEIQVAFSELELLEAYNAQLTTVTPITAEAVRDALLYLSKIEALTLEGGFLVLYQTMHIRRLEMDNRIQYKQEDYKQLNEFYKQKIQMIHIVGEYANMMVRDYNEALQFVSDYFQMDYKAFLAKYFKGNRLGEINRNITPQKYNELMGKLSDRQREIIDDESSQYIVVAAGPGSGKTMLLVHKLAALVMLDDVKYEQLLMLTFSRAAATEFKSRLLALIGNAAKFIEIKTFHSYCFDLLGKIGSLEQSENIVPRAVEMIRAGEVEQIRVTKTIVVIDEAQDMDANEFDLIRALMECNANMRVIAVGDDDQNIYAFRGSDSKYMRSFITEHGAKQYDLPDNYRSTSEIVALANRFAETIKGRLKSEPIKAVRTDAGIVRLIRHKSSNLEYPIVQNLISNRTPGKTICVLTWTNDEALRVNGLLRQMQIPSKLIQSNDGFSLYDLAELRMFLKLTGKENHPIISDEQWEQAITDLKRIYSSSQCLTLVLNLLDRFSSVNEKKYRSDLESFIRESQMSDFAFPDDDEIIVSTIHKAKGHEFDCVYLLLNHVDISDNERNRALYVGMTRAKTELYLHYNNHAFDRFSEQIIDDTVLYPEPNQIMLQLTHRDVVLSFFMDKKAAILNLRSGDTLTLKGKCLYAQIGGKTIRAAILSKAAQDTLNRLYAKGYRVQSARIRFVVAWRNQDETDDKEYAIILPDVFLEK
ncbi:MAG: RecQ family ATP-dependent DNA helicase [Oscillospiraceae bacterium]|nr:RecQ family ATP-dependent DNA helicase [Oscillospiraceae bacterium]